MMVENNGQEETSGRRPNRSEVTTGGADKKRKSIPRMVPLLSRRSIIVLAIGIIIGIAGGLGYWVISPSLHSEEPTAQEDTAPPFILGGEFKGPFESTVKIQIVNPGSSYASLTDLQRAAEYYAAKANSFPFLDFLAQELEESAPIYSHTAEELDQMILIGYDSGYDVISSSSTEVPVIEITTIGATMDETLYLTAFVPTVFKDFLASEEEELRLQEYASLVKAINDVKQDLLEAEQELADFSLEGVTSNIEHDATYISLTATVAALEVELNSQASQLATLVATGDQSQTYWDAVTALEETSEALAEAKNDLAILRAQRNIDYIGQDLDYRIAQARVDNLSQEITSQIDRVTALLAGDSDEPTALEYMVVGTPTTPTPSIDRIRGRDAVLLGGILGLGVAWVTLNFKWLVKGMPSYNVRRREEEEEETA